ncbi:MAG: hypothetical protein KF802_01105 [Bdellovibrionaceae bacterium]|nr:hypothetical protein [Pseudobdellovibrionaceae bacterium]
MKRLECLNFTPREDFLHHVQREFERLQAQSPSDAEIEAKAFFNEDRFVMELGIHSSEGHFRTAIGVPIPKDHPRGRSWQSAALDEAMNDLHHQLRRWRKARRLPPAA